MEWREDYFGRIETIVTQLRQDMQILPDGDEKDRIQELLEAMLQIIHCDTQIE